MTIQEEVKHIFEQLVDWRRYFHRHPELGYEEHNTASVVAKTLKDWGYTVQEGIARTGVVGLLENGPGPVVMARVDMDALPIQEESDVPYASETPGVMHACGHDAHIAIGLGTARLMAEQRETWQGTLKLIFQPAEEGGNGADLMIEEGVLENPRPDTALAIHVWNDKPAGVVAVRPGPVMAAAEIWNAVITGKGGHAAHPELSVDPIAVAALTVTALQTVVSRNVGALQSAVVTVGALLSGDAFNVIPDSAELRGTIRTFDPHVRASVLQRTREIIQGTAQAMGADVTLEIESLTPAVVNDAQVTTVVQDVVRDLLGSDALDTGMQTMGSEDAALFLQAVPGCYFFIGSRPEKNPASHHNPHFDIDESALYNGTLVLVAALQRLMSKETP